MDDLMDARRARLLAWGVSGIFLLIHCGMLAMFAICQVTPMVQFNVFSIFFYCASFYIIWQGHFRFFAVTTYLEVVLHMTLATLFTGWDNAFQITLIGMCTLAFFAEFLARLAQERHVHAALLCVFGTLTYLVACALTYGKPPLYPLPDQLSFWLQIIWAIVVFTINITALWEFMMVSFHAEELLSRRAATDNLTGLPNRYHVNRKGESYMHDGGWVAMLDIDDFKHINDSYGHNFGDEVLRTVASLVRESIGDAEACRWGGEEFLILGISDDIRVAENLLERIRAKVESHSFSYEGREVRVTITIGLAAYQGEQDLSTWINMADKKLYVGKRSGKNQVIL